MTQDTIRVRLNKKYDGRIQFGAPAKKLLLGEIDFPTEYGRIGKNISVSKVGDFTPELADLETGRVLRPGVDERLQYATLRCFEKGGTVQVALFRDLEQISLALEADLRGPLHGSEDIPEGWFARFGPVEYFGTPWSDMDPNRCTVITVEDLRWYGGVPPGTAWY